MSGTDTNSSSSGEKASKKKTSSKKALPPFQLFDPDTEEKTFQNGLKAAVNLLHGRKNVVVLCGAGISVSCGIPDFRSKGGIYDQIDIHDYGLCTPEEIFHLEVFQDNPRPFYKFAGKMLYPNRPHEPSPSHRFLALLEEKKMLLRVYTQNIDGLEEKAGLSPKRVVYAHGSLNTSSCLKCGGKAPAEDLRDEILLGNVPYCQKITGRRKRRRGEDVPTGEDPDEKVAVRCGGVMKPNITFFGEPLVDRVRRCLESDQAKADAVIVIGTSLSVAPISKIIKYLRPSIPRLLINRTIVIPKHTDGDSDDLDEAGEDKDHRDGYLFDALMLGFCDEVIKALSYVLSNGNGSNANANASSNSNGKSINSESTKKSNNKTNTTRLFPFQSQDCKMLCNDMSKVESIGETCLLNHPMDRILMFPGGKLEVHNNDEISYHEVVHCDECHCIIKSTIYKCIDCFDYDLCPKCHSCKAINKNHHGGEHTFIAEKA